MKRIKTVLLLLVVLGLSAWSSAQETMTLTISKSVEMVLKKNPGINIGQSQVAKANAGVIEAWSALLPSINGSASLLHTWGEPQTQKMPNFIKEGLGPLATDDMPDFIEIAFGIDNTLRYGLSLTQPLFLGGAGIAGVQMAKAGAQAESYRFQAQKQTMIHQTASAFYGCVLAQRLVDVQKDALTQAEANLKRVAIKYNAGSASGFDKMRAEVEVANIRPQLISAENNLQVALTGLKLMLGIDKEQSIKIEGDLAYKIDELDDCALDACQDAALKNRPEVAMMEAQNRLAGKGVTLARSAFMPKLFFQTDYSFLGMRNDFKFNHADMSKGFTSSLTLQVPLFNGLKNVNGVQKAQLDVKIARDSKRQMLNGVQAEVEVAYNNFQEAKARHEAASESIDLAEEALRLANLMYEEGASTQLDVLNSQLALNRARLNHASTLYDYMMARYDMRRVMGQLNANID